MSAILREEPPDLSATNKNVPPGLERIVRHCLEKSPEERFHSAHDLAFDLQALSGDHGQRRRRPRAPNGSRVFGRSGDRRRAPRPGRRRWPPGYFLGKSKGVSAPPTFKQLTFRRGAIWSARFGSDGKSILTTAAWDGKPAQIYVSRPESPEAAAFGVPDADIAAVSSTGEVAVLLKADFDTAFTRAGTLARVGATGGAPRELLEKVEYADWTPDGKDLAIVRVVGGEVPARVSRGQGPLRDDGLGREPALLTEGRPHRVPGPSGRERRRRHGRGRGPRGKEDDPVAGVRARRTASPGRRTARRSGTPRPRSGPTGRSMAASLSGKTRILARVSGNLTLRDVARDGRVLIDHDTNQVGIVARAAGSPKDIDLTWLDWSLLNDISADGRFVLFSETGEGGGRGYSVYVRNLDGSPAVRLGEGNGQSISPDGKRVLALIGPSRVARRHHLSDGRGRGEEDSRPRTDRPWDAMAA